MTVRSLVYALSPMLVCMVGWDSAQMTWVAATAGSPTETRSRLPSLTKFTLVLPSLGYLTMALSWILDAIPAAYNIQEPMTMIWRKSWLGTWAMCWGWWTTFCCWSRPIRRSRRESLPSHPLAASDEN